MEGSQYSTRRLTRTVAFTVALTLGALAMRELARPRQERARLLDWELVEAIALRSCGEPENAQLEPALAGLYDQIGAEIRPVLESALGPGQAGTPVAYPQLVPVGRRDWVRFNVRIFKEMFAPLQNLEAWLPGSLMVDLGRRGLSRYLGLMLGLLARRVLGQYDPALLATEPIAASTLVLVEPNVQQWAKRDSLPLDELRRWLAMHELTHAWEFKGHPWLQGYLEALLRQVLVGRLSEGQRPSPLELLRTMTVGVGQQWKAIAKLQAAMSLLEGYSNLIMDDIGRQHLPRFAMLEAAYQRRLQQRTPLERAFLRLTGLEMKMRQYVQGERFCRMLQEAGGPPLLARVWEGPGWLPTMAEIQRPELWVERVRQAA
jgi:coenzyme F420 biosynthesis associated uncharacterized protein